MADEARRGARSLEWWPVERLRPYEKNPRKHPEEQIAALAALITEVGFNQPILVDGAAGIIAGHGRLLAARRLGMREVPVIELTHMTPAQKQAQIVADNKMALMAGWDERLLAAELEEIAEAGFDIKLTGFSEVDLQRLQDDLDAAELRDTARASTESAPPPAPSGQQGADSSSTEAQPAAVAPGAGSEREEQLPFSVVMSADDRARLFEALAAAKAKWNLQTAAHALLALANDFLRRQRETG